MKGKSVQGMSFSVPATNPHWYQQPEHEHCQTSKYFISVILVARESFEILHYAQIFEKNFSKWKIWMGKYVTMISTPLSCIIKASELLMKYYKSSIKVVRKYFHNVWTSVREFYDWSLMKKFLNTAIYKYDPNKIVWQA